MKKNNDYALKGLKALKRAALNVLEKAKRDNHKIPFLRDGHIIYEVPKITTEPKDTVDQKKV